MRNPPLKRPPKHAVDEGPDYVGLPCAWPGCPQFAADMTLRHSPLPLEPEPRPVMLNVLNRVEIYIAENWMHRLGIMFPLSAAPTSYVRWAVWNAIEIDALGFYLDSPVETCVSEVRDCIKRRQYIMAGVYQHVYCGIASRYTDYFPPLNNLDPRILQPKEWMQARVYFLDGVGDIVPAAYFQASGDLFKYDPEFRGSWPPTK